MAWRRRGTYSHQQIRSVLHCTSETSLTSTPSILASGQLSLRQLVTSFVQGFYLNPFCPGSFPFSHPLQPGWPLTLGPKAPAPGHLHLQFILP